jgi:hypothetical protein
MFFCGTREDVTPTNFKNRTQLQQPTLSSPLHTVEENLVQLQLAVLENVRNGTQIQAMRIQIYHQLKDLGTILSVMRI